MEEGTENRVIFDSITNFDTEEFYQFPENHRDKEIT